MAAKSEQVDTMMAAGSSTEMDSSPAVGKGSEKTKKATSTHKAGPPAKLKKVTATTPAVKPKKASGTRRANSAAKSKEATSTAAATSSTSKPKKTAGMTAASSAPKPKKVTRKTSTKEEEEEINRLLIMAGIDKPEEKSKCVRAGLARGHFGFTFTGEASQLDIIVQPQEKCEFCDDGTYKATVRQLLEQADYGGDYEDGSKGAAVKCDGKDCNFRQYLTRCCLSSDMRWNDGKFHNHCSECDYLGICIGDYREAHCYECNGHYFAGFIGNFPCGCTERRNKTPGMDAMRILFALLLADNSDDDSDETDD